jgi:hypothetical protein
MRNLILAICPWKHATMNKKIGRKKDYIVVGIDYMIRSAKLST